MTKKLLEGKLVSGVFSSVDDIEARNRHGLGDGVFGNLGVVLPKRNSLGGGSGLGGGKRYSKNGVGSNIGLVVGSIGLDHGLVNGALVGGIDSHDGVGQDGLGVFDGLQATLSEVSGTSVTKFVGLVGTGGGTGWDTGGVGSGGGGDIDLDGRISSGIDDFAGVDTGDGGHHALGGDTGGGLSGNSARELGQHGEWMD